MQIEKVSYEINWRAFKRGTSIFIPCLNPKQAKKDVVEVMRRVRVKTITKVVIEEGIRGLRIWRM